MADNNTEATPLCDWCKIYTPEKLIIQCPNCKLNYCFTCFYNKVLKILEGKCVDVECGNKFELYQFTDRNAIYQIENSANLIKSNRSENHLVYAIENAMKTGREKMICPALEKFNYCDITQHINEQNTFEMFQFHNPEIVVCEDVVTGCKDPKCPYQHPNLAQKRIGVYQKDVRTKKEKNLCLDYLYRGYCEDDDCPFEHKKVQ
ncbi:hypothetical protein M0811_00832 [Anaeramoeba ignava]|uniref:C3H1-type domain-containing protein n=1 Tax=Anaeramoeba ignava TaxID=1746090 RepID=A0A9Q0RC61_ANAIG|nr:hypothetical protein M0811_00832 [Anaeramoeba ignava]